MYSYASASIARDGKKTVVPIHRLIAEQYLKRRLASGEVVHHINENIHDNRIENLIVFESQMHHKIYHERGRIGYHKRWGIVLYGPALKNRKKQRYKEFAERTKRDLGLIAVN